MEAVYHPLLRHKGRMILCLSRSVKRNSKLFRALPHFLIFLAVAAPALAQVYKWVDERGVTHYGERPPQGGKASEAPSRLGQGEIPAKDREPRPGTAQTERTEEQQTRRQEQCNQQRELLARLKQSPQLENSDAIARQEKLAAEQCRG